MFQGIDTIILRVSDFQFFDLDGNVLEACQVHQ
jgi:hypothetical protein